VYLARLSLAGIRNPAQKNQPQAGAAISLPKATAIIALRTRYLRIAGFLDERGRRLFAANEALGLGRGGVTAVFAASGIARSTLQHQSSTQDIESLNYGYQYPDSILAFLSLLRFDCFASSP